MYIPRLTFKRVFLDGSEQETKSDRSVSIPFTNSKSAQTFWRFIGFLYSYKELVDIGEFKQSFKVIAKNSYFLEFKSKNDKQKIEDLKELINLTDLSSSDIKALTFHNRKKNLEAFLFLLKNKKLESGQESQSYYREKYSIQNGEEHIWHHFLASNEWILGLNADVKFIREFLDEQYVGVDNSKKRKNPSVDIPGVSEFTVLIELKHTNAEIFKVPRRGSENPTPLGG